MKDTYLIAIMLYEAAVAAGAPPDVCQCCGTAVAAQSPQEYAERMRAWAGAVYQAWAPHHEWARRELARIFA